MPKVLSKREKLIVYLTIGVIAFAILSNAVIIPLFNKNEELNKQIAYSKIKLVKYLRLMNQKDAIQNIFTQFSRNAKLSDNKEDRIIEVLSEIETLAKTASVRIIDLRPQSAAKDASSYKELIVDLKAEGSVEGFMKFIYDLENSLSLLKIKRFQLSSKPNSQLLEANFSISQLSLSH